MGRRKIEIKAIKDDRNRSVTFLKRKGGLFKKAHELSVLCSVDVAVFIFGNNKKLYEYSSGDMHELIARYQYHGGPSEHKGPNDFTGGGDDDDDDEGDLTPPRGHEDAQMMPPQYHPQHPHFSQIRHHTSTASPPIPNGAPFSIHHGHHQLHSRGHSPQPPMGRPDSQNDGRRISSVMVPPAPPGAHPTMTYMPAPPIYAGPPAATQSMMHPQSTQYYPPPHQSQNHPFSDDRRPSQPHLNQHQQQQQQQQQQQPRYTPQPSTQAVQVPPQPEPQPQQPPPHPAIQISAPHPDRRPINAQPFATANDVNPEADRRQLPMLNTDSAIKKMPQRRAHSIFTPVEENRSILLQHSRFINTNDSAIKEEPASRSHSVDGSSAKRDSPIPRSHSSMDKSRNVSLPDVSFAPPSRSNSVVTGSLPGRPRGPKLTVQIPDGGSEPGSAATGESSSPRNPSDTSNNAKRRHGSVVLPPPSPSASTLLSAGTSGPPNPFARPVHHQGIGNNASSNNNSNSNSSISNSSNTNGNGSNGSNNNNLNSQSNSNNLNSSSSSNSSNNIMNSSSSGGSGGSNINNETPVSALPSRVMNGSELLPSPNSFYPEWNYRASDSNTLPSPLNFATPVAGSGPMFLRDDTGQTTASSSATTSSATTTANAGLGDKTRDGLKRKNDGSSTPSASSQGPIAEPKRIKVE